MGNGPFYLTAQQVLMQTKVVLIATGETDNTMLFGVGSYRGVFRRETRNRWHWRVWNVVGAETVARGYCKTRLEAHRLCYDELHKAAGIEQVAEGQ